MKSAWLKALGAVVLLLAIFGGGYGYWRLQTPGGPTAASTTDARAALYWYDPMVPDQRFDKPGKSPFMDMQLVPKYADDAPDAGADDGAFRIDPRVAQNLGVRLAKAEIGRMAREVRSVGVVAVDEHRIEVVQVRAAGWVEQLAVRAAGDPVRRGALLAAVYAPRSRSSCWRSDPATKDSKPLRGRGSACSDCRRGRSRALPRAALLSGACPITRHSMATSWNSARGWARPCSRG
jgi:hypothetical protein